MLQKQIVTNSWGIGLSAEELSVLRQTLGDNHQVLPKSREELLAGCARNLNPPFVLWVAAHCRHFLDDLPEASAEQIALAPRVLVFGDSYGLEDFETACEAGFTEFLRPPLSRERISGIMRKALEHYALHHDMECMAREILLERELLERKHDIMGFLVNFLSSASESLDITCLLQNAFESLRQLIPMRSMHAVFWDQGQECTPGLYLYINAREGSAEHQAWREKLIEAARAVIGPTSASTKVHELDLHGSAAPEPGLPDHNALISVPLTCGAEQLGLLILSTTLQTHLGRDQAVALDSAMRSFSVSVKNARRFQQMQLYADYDALTKVHSRRHFEDHLRKEMERVTRYDQPLALIMLDIDHFKQVNDNYGHHIGDVILKETGAIIADSIRTIDYCARYGGEEFVIILPHTGKNQAHAIAERIRKAIADHTFRVEDAAPLCITVSLGLSAVTPGHQKNRQALICEADSALYKAKQSGRNRTCTTALLMAKAQ